MNEPASKNRAEPKGKTVAGVPEPAGDAGHQSPPDHSRFEKFAATQAAGDGIEGDALKPGKTVDEKLGANMPDRK